MCTCRMYNLPCITVIVIVNLIIIITITTTIVVVVIICHRIAIVQIEREIDGVHPICI